MNLDQALQTFIIEARELLRDMEMHLLNLERDPGDVDAINAVFRAAHTIKGSAGLFGRDRIVAFTHVVENVLDQVRDGKIQITPELAAVLLQSGDHIDALVTVTAESNDEPDEGMNVRETELLGLLNGFLGGAAPAAEEAPPPAAAAPAGGVYHLSLRFGRDVLRSGMDPQSFIRYLGQLGTVTALAVLDDAIPPLDELDAEACYLGFEMTFASGADQAAIEGVFDFVREDSVVQVLPADAPADAWRRLRAALPESDETLRELWLEHGLVGVALAQQIFAEEAEAGQETAAQPEKRAPAGDRRQGLRRGSDNQYIRIQADKLDEVINLVGELVIATAGAAMVAEGGTMQEAIAGIAHLVEEIRDGALRLRMVEIGETFNKFQRVVRDIGHELGKDIQLAISGGETELDKTVVEKIGDPLTHLVRNAMDHGIEPAATRLARGKPEQGTVRLNAWHDSGSIVIEVSDDGGGLNRDRILAKGTERGLVAPGQQLSDKDIYNLIFEPGFSTAEAITNLSGRGVGMDVVSRNIKELRGTIDLDSEEGVGTTVRIRLPLTLAIIDGFLVRVGDASYVVPLDMVMECVELDAAGGGADRNYINLRGEVLPYIKLREIFDLDVADADRRENIVVVQYGGQRAGLVVDELQGEFQTVIKPLGQMFRHLKGISGSTILGTGDVALILDVPALVHQAIRHESDGVQAARGTPARV